MLFTKKEKEQKWEIKKEILELLNGKQNVVVGVDDKTVLMGQGGDVADIIINILINLERCTAPEFVYDVVDTYKTISELNNCSAQNAPKKRGRKPKKNIEKKEGK